MAHEFEDQILYLRRGSLARSLFGQGLAIGRPVSGSMPRIAISRSAYLRFWAAPKPLGGKANQGLPCLVALISVIDTDAPRVVAPPSTATPGTRPYQPEGAGPVCLTPSNDGTPVCLDQVQRQLHLPEPIAAWLASIPRPPGAAEPLLPDDAAAAELLGRLGVPDPADALAARPNRTGDPELWWVLDRLYQEMVATMGEPAPREGFFGWPAIPDERGGMVARHLYVWLFLALVPLVRRYHAEHDVPDDVSWDSLGCLGSAMAAARQLSSKPGLDGVWSMPLAFRGALYPLGRLTFERIAAAPDGADFPPLPPGTCAIGTHIADTGPLDPKACNASFAYARDFLRRHFAERPAAFICHSWLLDPQLAEYLPAESNLVRFQRRFTLKPNQFETSHNEILQFVFHHEHHGPRIPEELLAELPQDTTLQRAYVTHLRSGHRWYLRSGWAALDAGLENRTAREETPDRGNYLSAND